MTISEWKDVSTIVASLVTIGATLAAACWFLFSRSFRQRIEFDAELKIYDVEGEDYACQLRLILTNKGQREHQIRNLLCEVRESSMATKNTKMKSYFGPANLVKGKNSIVFVPAGVTQVFPKTFAIPKSAKLVRVRASFTYGGAYISTAEIRKLTFEGLDNSPRVTDDVSKLIVVKPTDS